MVDMVSLLSLALCFGSCPSHSVHPQFLDTPLHTVTSAQDNSSVVKLLLEHGAEIEGCVNQVVDAFLSLSCLSVSGLSLSVSLSLSHSISLYLSLSPSYRQNFLTPLEQARTNRPHSLSVLEQYQVGSSSLLSLLFA
jgi:hypothetical protein